MGAASEGEGAPVPDISSVGGVEENVAQREVGDLHGSRTGTSAASISDATVLPRLGMRDEVRAKTKLGQGGSVAEIVASGEAEIAFQNVTELLPVKGVKVVGLPPAELQSPIVYAGAVMNGAKNPGEAQQLLDYLASPPGRRVFLDKGFAAP